MNFYKFYTGDYIRDTMELEAAEEGIYIRLMNWYYANERPIPDVRAPAIARVTSKADIDRTYWVLDRFFKKVTRHSESVWTHPRIDIEISLAQKRIKASIDNGKRGGRPKKTKPTGFNLGYLDETQSESYPDPDLLKSGGKRRSPRGKKKVGPQEEALSPSPASSPTSVTTKQRARESKSSPVWNAYAMAYESRYGAAPAPNAKNYSLCCQLIDRIGAADAPHVAGWYLSTKANPYARSGHSLALLVRDAEKIHTEWRTGRRTTETGSRDGDRLQEQGDMWARVIEKKGT